MAIDEIAAIGIDDSGSLWIRPSTSQFPFIYREAKEVHWDQERLCLYSPTPREWSYLDWYDHIIETVGNLGTTLRVNAATDWLNIEDDLREKIENRSAS